MMDDFERLGRAARGGRVAHTGFLDPDEAAALAAQIGEIDAQLATIEDRLVAGEALDALVKAGRRLEDKKADLAPRLAAAAERARHPQGEAWGACHTLITALASAEDREAARLRLQSAIRRVVSRVDVLFARDGRRHIACAQLRFHGTGAVRTVFVRHRVRLVNSVDETPEHVSWSTLKDELPGKVEITTQHAAVLPVLERMCGEAYWHEAFEPGRPTTRERIRLRKQRYMKAYRRTRRTGGRRPATGPPGTPPAAPHRGS